MESLRIVVNGTLDCGKETVEKLNRVDIASDTAKIIIMRQAEGNEITITRAGGSFAEIPEGMIPAVCLYLQGFCGTDVE